MGTRLMRRPLPLRDKMSTSQKKLINSGGTMNRPGPLSVCGVMTRPRPVMAARPLTVELLHMIAAALPMTAPGPAVKRRHGIVNG